MTVEFDMKIGHIHKCTLVMISEMYVSNYKYGDDTKLEGYVHKCKI